MTADGQMRSSATVCFGNGAGYLDRENEMRDMDERFAVQSSHACEASIEAQALLDSLDESGAQGSKSGGA